MSDRRVIPVCDLTYAGLDQGYYCVHEQLYPETRGFINHQFKSEEAAKRFAQNGIKISSVGSVCS